MFNLAARAGGASGPINPIPLMKNNRLLKLNLAGFKLIDRLSLDIGDINDLIGGNGSGKSNLIPFL